MKLTNMVALLALVILFPGCARQEKETVPESVRLTLQNIASVDVNMDHYSSYAEYHKQVYGQIKAMIRPLSSSVELKALFLECHHRWRTAPEMPQERLQWINPNSQACYAAIRRLAELDSDEATKVLVDLYANKTLRWDGEFAMNAAHAISRCGKRAIPYLAKNSFGDRSAHFQEVIQCIEKGELYGP